jgi:hypothetical protein
MKNKTERGRQSTSRKPRNSEKYCRKASRQTKSLTRGKFRSTNKETAHSLEKPGELVARPYQESDNGQSWARLTFLNPAKVEEMIQELSDLREALAPQVSTTIAAGQRMFVTPEPIWKVSDEVREDGKVLLIRHPGIGWLGFIIPHDDCKRLAKKLTA